MSLICDKCKQPVKVFKDFKKSGLDLCNPCSELFNDEIATMVENFIKETKRKSIFRDFGKFFDNK